MEVPWDHMPSSAVHLWATSDEEILELSSGVSVPEHDFQKAGRGVHGEMGRKAIFF